MCILLITQLFGKWEGLDPVNRCNHNWSSLFQLTVLNRSAMVMPSKFLVAFLFLKCFVGVGALAHD